MAANNNAHRVSNLVMAFGILLLMFLSFGAQCRFLNQRERAQMAVTTNEIQENIPGAINYRAATTADIDALAQLARISFVDAFGHLYRAEDLQMFVDRTYATATIAAEMANPQRLYRLAECDGALVGYCKLGLATSFAHDLSPRRVIDLAQLYLHRDMTGKGVGDALMQWALQEARDRGYDDMLLSVYSENFGAQRFYHRYGFAKYADTFFMVGNHRDDEFLYHLALT
jgi:ribosomal protein S18 acetylase RimI-like enzyme